jgi:site-specific recombinase XerD
MTPVTALIGQDTGADMVPLPAVPALEQVWDFIRQSKAPNTIRGYRTEWNQFTAWADSHGKEPLPATPETVALYLTERAATHKATSLNRTVSSISQAHQMAGFESPTRTAAVRTLLAGIRRANGTAPAVKAPALTEDIRGMVAALPANLLGVRDRALLLVGFAGAFRRSELVSLDVEDCAFGKEGLTVTLRRSKTDQQGVGRKIGIPYGSNPETCPVRALRAWLETSGIAAGPLFRYVNRHGQMQPGRLSGYAVALIVKRYAAAARLDPARYAGHSLRAGLATSAAIGGASERSIMNQTGHRSVQMVRRYIRDGSLFRENAAAKTGL